MSDCLWPRRLQPTKFLCPWGSSKQEYWGGLPCPPPGDLPDPAIKPGFLRSPALAGRFFTTSTTWEALLNKKTSQISPKTDACQKTTNRAQWWKTARRTYWRVVKGRGIFKLRCKINKEPIVLRGNSLWKGPVVWKTLASSGGRSLMAKRESAERSREPDNADPMRQGRHPELFQAVRHWTVLVDN